MAKVVLVTGASSGIGKAVATVLHEKGYKVYGTSRKPEKHDLPYALVAMDVENDASVKRCVEEVLQYAGHIDVLVNNAGIGVVSAMEETGDEIMGNVFNINTHGPLRVCRAVLPAMRRQQYGTIINVSSIAGAVGLPFRGVYSASKAALEGYTEALSMEVKAFGIKVVIVEPGDFRTNINESRQMHGGGHESPYGRAIDNTDRLIHEEVSHAGDPVQVGRLVHKILRKKRPALRYRCGTLLQRLTPVIKHILPDRWFETLIMRHYHLK